MQMECLERLQDPHLASLQHQPPRLAHGSGGYSYRLLTTFTVVYLGPLGTVQIWSCGAKREDNSVTKQNETNAVYCVCDNKDQDRRRLERGGGAQE
jgi:hypothetical protein